MSKHLHWLTTSPHPWRPAHTHGADQGQVGWKRHAVVTEETEFSKIKRAPSLCGLRAKHGWGLDLFIEDECSKCCAKIDASAELPALADAEDKR